MGHKNHVTCTSSPCSTIGGVGMLSDQGQSLDEKLFESQPQYRRWTSKCSSDSADEGLVPHLRAALKDVGMSSYIAAVEAWCDSAGAVRLEELEEEIESIGEDLGLTENECSRLRKALPEQQSPPACCSAFPTLRRTVVVHPLLSPVGAVDEEQQLSPLSPQLQQQRLCERSFVALSKGDACGMLHQVQKEILSAEHSLPRLRSALAEAGLEGLASQAEAWCLETGAVFLAESLEELDSFCAALGIDMVQEVKLHAALQARATGLTKGADWRPCPRRASSLQVGGLPTRRY